MTHTFLSIWQLASEILQALIFFAPLYRAQLRHHNMHDDASMFLYVTYIEFFQLYNLIVAMATITTR